MHFNIVIYSIHVTSFFENEFLQNYHKKEGLKNNTVLQKENQEINLT